MAKQGFSVTIAANDAASGPIDKINKRLRDMRKPVDELAASNAKLAQSFGQLSENTGITPALQTIKSGVVGIGRSAEMAAAGLSRPAPALSAVTAAGSVAGLAGLVNHFASAGRELKNTAARAGLATDQLQALENGARLAGAASGSMSSGLITLRDNLKNAAAGRAPEFVKLMSSLGLAWRNADGSALDLNEALPKITDKIAALHDPTLEAIAATGAFGGAGEGLLPILRRGGAGLDEYRRKAIALGLINQDAAKEADRLAEAQAALGISAENLGNSIALALAPTVAPLLNDFARWIATSDGVKRGIRGIGDEVRFLGDNIDSLGTIAAHAGEFWLMKKLFGFLPALAVETTRLGFGIPSLNSGESADLDKLYPNRPRGTPAGPAAPAGPNWWQRNMPRYLGGDSDGPHGQSTYQGGLGVRSSVNSAVPPEGRALLDAISVGESDGTYRDQPSSTGAKGRYQFLDSTWREVAGKTGLAAFTPENQDKNAWFYAQERYRISTGRDLDGDLKAGINPAQGLNRIWTSLPGGPEHNNATDGFAGRLSANLAADMPQYGPPVPSPIAATPTAGPSGTANMTIRLAGFPNGTTTAASASGDIWDSPPKVERGMALAAPQ